jgi:penicillin G amidase
MTFAAAALRRLARTSLPVLEGTQLLRGLDAPVEVIRDRYGFVHIYGETRLDVARAQGYVHAQDRLWQMESVRRFAFGRLSELAGLRTLELDRLARRLRLRRSAEQDAAACDPDAAALAAGYCEGVNAFLRRSPLPIELRLARLRPEPWTPVDVQAPAQMFALALSGNWEGELARSALAARLGEEDAWRLDPEYPDDHPVTVPASLAAAPSPAFRGRGASNGFVVSGVRTASGKPILANDPHLLLGIPGIWHAQHLVWAGGEVWGFTVAGAPVVILGRNRRVAWGLTTAMLDNQDLFVERFHPEERRRYEVDGEWLEAEVLREEIRVRGRRAPVVEEILVTRHGPLVGPVAEGRGLALCWSSHEPTETTRALLDLEVAENVEEADRALDRFAAPPHNVVLADDSGTIGYRLAGGPIPRRRAGAGRVPAPGWNGEHEWDGWIPVEDLPRARDPAHGFLVSANNRIVGDDYPYELPGDYLSGYRARRLEILLAAGDGLTPRECAAFLLDRLSLPGLELADALQNRVADDPLERKLLATLTSWDGDLGPESAGGAVYGALIDALEREVFGELGAPADLPAGLVERTRPALIRALAERDDAFLGSGRSWDEILSRALAAAVVTLGPDPARWRRGRLHRLRLAHGLDAIPRLGRFLARGPFPAGGDADTVNVLAPAAGVAPDAMIGASMRAVYDLADPDGTLVALVPGQSGHPASPHYDDLLPGWLRGEYVPLATDRARVEALAEARLVLAPE